MLGCNYRPLSTASKDRCNGHPHPRRACIQLVDNMKFNDERIRHAEFQDRGLGTLIDGCTNEDDVARIISHYFSTSSGSGLRNAIAFLLSHYGSSFNVTTITPLCVVFFQLLSGTARFFFKLNHQEWVTLKFYSLARFAKTINHLIAHQTYGNTTLINIKVKH